MVCLNPKEKSKIPKFNHGKYQTRSDNSSSFQRSEVLLDRAAGGNYESRKPVFGNLVRERDRDHHNPTTA
jgi:hypothetical protein